MSNDQIITHINTLIRDSQKLLCNFSVGVLSQCLDEASKIDDFYKINYDKYGKKIIEDSKLSETKKEEIRKRFTNPQLRNQPTVQRNTNAISEKVDYFSKQPIFHKPIKCKSCDQLIENQPIFFSGYPYHIHCVKCMKCGLTCEKLSDSNNFTCITPDLFLCKEDYINYQSSKQLSAENYEEYHKKNKENFVEQLFDNSLQDAVYAESDSEFSLLSPEIIEDAIPVNIPYEYLIPTATFELDKSPENIDFDQLQEILGEDVIIVNVERGCTFLKIAFHSIKKFIGNCADQIEKCAQKVKGVIMTIGKAVIGNLVDEPIVKVPKDDEIQALYNKSSKNLLQNTYELNDIELEEIKEEVFSKLVAENDKKNWNFLFKHEKIFKDVEDKIRADIIDNDFEMVLIAQTVIANRRLEEFLKAKNDFNLKHFFVYHGTKLNAHQSIVNNHFYMPGQDIIPHATDDGWYGQGIYSTDNLVYASVYCNNYHILACKEKAHIICCIAIYNDSQVVDIHDNVTYRGKPIQNKVKQNCGMHRVLVGSGNNFEPIKENERDDSFISAQEFVFANKFQIIPIYSFTVMRKDHFILWKDDHIDNSENSTYRKQVQKKMEVNVYGVDSVQKALDIIKKKKRNKFKLMTNAGASGAQFINDARNIVGSNFVSLVFTGSLKHLDWATKMENVLLTTSAASFRKFAELEMDENKIIDFAHELEEKHDCKFIINRNELLNFPINNIYAHDPFYRSAY